MFYGKGNHIANCIGYVISYVILVVLAFRFPPRDIVLWRMIVMGLLFSVLFFISCKGELVLRKMKREKKEFEEIENTRENYMYLLLATMVVAVIASVLLLRV